MSKPWFRRRQLMIFPIHPMGWFTYGLFFLAGGLWTAFDSDFFVGPEWLTNGADFLPAVALLGMGIALIAKTEKR